MRYRRIQNVYEPGLSAAVEIRESLEERVVVDAVLLPQST
jgi:hypothetical protein